MNTSPLISVVIPTYNRKDFLTRTIDSVLNQSLTEIEVIVVDDGSTDGTSQYLEKKYQDDKRLKCKRVENGERGRARNLGISSSSAPLIVFLDSDDILLDEALSGYYDLSLLFPSTQIFAARYRINDGSNITHPTASLSETCSLDDLLQGNPLACNMMIRNSDAVLPFKEDRALSSMEDWIFACENSAISPIQMSEHEAVEMTDHAGRSMNSDHNNVIAARERATTHLLSTLLLSPAREKKLKAYSSYFCGIHSYLKASRSQVAQFVLKSVKNGGPLLQNGILLAKGMIGRRTILKLRRDS